MLEIEEKIMEKENSIFCVVETHQKRNNIHINDNINFLSKMRETKDKKGGGIALIWNKNDAPKVEEIVSSHSDILVSKINIGDCSFYIIVVYMSTNDDNRNCILYKELGKFTEKFLNEKILILGDFNGHIGVVGPQKMNKNGQKLINFTDKYNLNILNLDTNCSGEITWEQGIMNSAIDYALCNEKMYSHFLNMIIDEEWEVLKISDHNLININFSFKKNIKFVNKNKIITYNSKKDQDIDKYLNNIQQNINNSTNDMDMVAFNELIRDSQNKYLEKTFVKRLDNNNKPDPPWFN